MSHFKSFRANNEKVLNSPVRTYRQCPKEINLKMAQFDKVFSMPDVAAEYDVPYDTLRGRIR